MVSETRCVHDLGVNECGLCLTRAPRRLTDDGRVWVLPTGEVFHLADCFIIDATHEANLVRDTRDTPPIAVTVADARARGLRRCEFCSPDAR